MTANTKSIIYIQYTNPAAFPPLENSSRILAECGWQVEFIGTEALGLEDIKLPSHPNIKVDLIPFCPPGLKQKVHYFVFLLRALMGIARNRDSVIYVSDLFSSPVGWIAARFLGVRVFYHEHDTPDVPKTNFTRMLHWTRKELSQSAELCIFPQRERAQLFLSRFSDSKLAVCFNMPLKSSVRLCSSGEGDRPFYLWYHGSLLEERLPIEVVQALKYLPDHVILKFAGYETLSSKGFIDRLLQYSHTCGVRDRVEYCGVLETRDSLFQLAQTCHLGLSLFRRTFVEPMVGASNKPFDYLACGMPLLINDTPEWTHFFGPWGVAKSCNPESPESIASAIRGLIENPEEYQQMRNRAVQKISSDWNYESQFAPIKKILEA